MLPDRLVDHVITDPPYEAEAHTLQRRTRSTGRDGTVEKWTRHGRGTENVPINFEPITEDERDRCGNAVARLVSRWALVFCQVEATEAWRATMEPPLGYRRTCIWCKPDCQPQLTGDRPGMGYESIVAMHTEGRSEWNGGGTSGVFTHLSRPGQNNGAVYVKGQQRADHPTMKPIALMAELVELFTSPGDLILDPFAGSGTTGVAALRLGRRAILIEKDPKYAALCIERMEAEEAGSTLQARRAGQMPLIGEAPPRPTREKVR